VGAATIGECTSIDVPGWVVVVVAEGGGLLDADVHGATKRLCAKHRVSKAPRRRACKVDCGHESKKGHVRAEARATQIFSASSRLLSRLFVNNIPEFREVPV